MNVIVKSPLSISCIANVHTSQFTLKSEKWTGKIIYLIMYKLNDIIRPNWLLFSELKEEFVHYGIQQIHKRKFYRLIFSILVSFQTKGCAALRIDLTYQTPRTWILAVFSAPYKTYSNFIYTQEAINPTTRGNATFRKRHPRTNLQKHVARYFSS